MSENRNIEIAVSVISAQYTPQYGVPIEEIACYLLSEMDDWIDRHEKEFVSDFGKPYIKHELNSAVFEKWLVCYCLTRERSYGLSFKHIEDFLTCN